MYIVSWDEPGKLFGPTSQTKKFSDSEEDEAYKFYEHKKKEASGWTLSSLNPLGSKVEDVRIKKL